MFFNEQAYSVLLISSSKSINETFSELFQSSFFSPVRTVADLSSARRALSDRAYDMVIINSPLPDDTGVRFAIDLSAGSETVVLLLLRAELYEETTERVSERGVFTLSKPTSKSMLQTTLRWLISARERLRCNEKKTLSLEEKMEEIRIVNRAKWLLIEKNGLDEPTAHRYIEKQAMNRCVTRRVIAEEILNTG